MNNSNQLIKNADDIAGIIFSVGNAMAHGAGSVFETIGNFLAGLLDAFGKVLKNIPAVGKYLGGFFHWLGTIISAGSDLIAIFINGAIYLLANGFAGVLRILGGGLAVIIARDWGLIRKGVNDLLSGIGGVSIAIAAKLLAFLQAVFFLQMGERPLSKKEKEILRRVYRNSVALNNIRLIEGFAGLFSVNKRPFTLGNKIYMKHIRSDTDPGTFVHEVCHVWQYQRTGVRYIAEALWAQWTVPDAYNWKKEVERGRIRWQDFNREAQAQLVQDVFNHGRRIPSALTAGEFFDEEPISPNVEFKHRGADHTDLARKTVTLIRNKGIT